MKLYELPPEWSPQSGVMLTWPHSHDYWVDTLAAIDQVFVKTAAAIAPYEKVLISCFDEEHQQHINNLLRHADVDLTRIKIYPVKSNDIWVRDHGPMGVISNNGPVLLDFGFNGWGGKYPAEYDNELTRNLHKQHAFGRIPLETIPVVLEGGAIEVDGQGTLLTTRRCVLSPTRNPHLTQQQIEKHFRQLFGVSRVLWLEHGGLVGDDTDGHIDTLARFIDPQTIAYVSCIDPNDEHFAELQKMQAELRMFRNASGGPYQLVPLPLPKPCYATHDGRRLPASYANFLIINHAVLVPTYGDPDTDEQALITFAECFSDRKIIPISCLAAIQWFGAVHCFTKQLPVGVNL